MAYTLPDLTYAFDALEPAIDARTMEIHHDKHHAAYVSKLNAALEPYPELAQRTVEELLCTLDSLPEEIRAAVRNNGGGHSNHTLFWEIMTPGGAKEPVGKIAKALETTFGSYAAFQKEFETAGATRFGSGWAWLVLTEEKELKVISTPNQDSPLMEGMLPLFGNDVWEHAYYLQYQNRRPDYLKAWWSLLNWDLVEEAYSHLME